MISFILVASNGWVTISQSRHGAQLNTIKSQMAGEQLDYGPMVQQTLGYLWDLPASSTSTRGLGGGITWAWDPTLCDDLQPQFREDFFFIEYISCRDLKAAMHRGFSSWSANHPHIHFVEVTTECEHLDKERGGEGKAWKECPLVELPMCYARSTESFCVALVCPSMNTLPDGIYSARGAVGHTRSPSGTTATTKDRTKKKTLNPLSRIILLQTSRCRPLSRIISLD